MSGYSVKEKDIEQVGKPEANDCQQCLDTGFVNTVDGLRECPMCGEVDLYLEAYYGSEDEGE